MRDSRSVVLAATLWLGSLYSGVTTSAVASAREAMTAKAVASGREPLHDWCGVLAKCAEIGQHVQKFGFSAKSAHKISIPAHDALYLRTTPYHSHTRGLQVNMFISQFDMFRYHSNMSGS